MWYKYRDPISNLLTVQAILLDGFGFGHTVLDIYLTLLSIHKELCALGEAIDLVQTISERSIHYVALVILDLPPITWWYSVSY